LELDPNEDGDKDIYLILTQGTETSFGLKTQNGALLFPYGPFKPDLEDCKHLIAERVPLPSFGATLGKWFCIVTSESRLSRLMIVEVMPYDFQTRSTGITVQFHTWYFRLETQAHP
jgi:hypothetical protein